MITAELVLLFAIYAGLILGLFLGPKGSVNTFKENLPKLSARIEKHVVTGNGFAKTPSKPNTWGAP